MKYPIADTHAMKVRQAVLMVGGKGTRLLPLTERRPKPILSVADRPCIWYLARSMARAGIEEIVLACGYRPGEMEALGNGEDLGVKITYTYEDSPMGTGGALKLLEDRLDDVFVAANGDVFADVDIRGQIADHLSSGADVTMSVRYVEDPSQFGIALLDDDRFVQRFMEKPKPEEAYSHWINSGVYVVDRGVLGMIPPGEYYDFSKDLFPRLIGHGGGIRGFPMEGIWMDVGRPHDLMEANLAAAQREKSGTTPDGCVLRGRHYVSPDCSVSSSELDESAVSEGCDVSDSRLSRTLLLRDCKVDGAEISHSILGEGCVVSKGARITDSVLADFTVVGPGETITGDRIVRCMRSDYNSVLEKKRG